MSVLEPSQNEKKGGRGERAFEAGEESREDGCNKTGSLDGEGCMTAPGVSRRDEKLTGEEDHRSGEAREGCWGGGAQRAT